MNLNLMHNELIGTWKSDATDAATMETFGNVTMEFRNNGELVYSVFEGGKEQRILMTYEVDGNTLITDQPNSPQKEKTEFLLIGDRLELNYEGAKSKYIRIA
jgi:hypothetical protein